MKNKTIFSTTLMASSLALTATSTFAQETQENAPAKERSTGIEEVVVYARKTDETEQTVPISMVTQSSEQLDNAQVVTFNDFANLTPGLVITSGDPTSSSIKMRGVGLDHFGLAADPGVVILVDEFPQSRIGSVFGAFMDVQQVEVLKGPQGTLYGRNAPNGAINIWSKKPDFDGIHGYVDLDVSEDNTYQAEMAVNLPLIDEKLSMRFAHLQTESDGWTDLARYQTDTSDPNQVRYIYDGDKVDADTRNGESNRLTILFEPIESLNILAKLNHTDYSQGSVSRIVDGPVVFDPLIDPVDGVTPITTLPSIVVDSNGNQFVADRSDNLMFQENRDTNDFQLSEAGIRTQWDNEYGSLISLSLYQEFETSLSETASDVAPKEYILPRELGSFDRLVSQELRWQSDLTDDISYIAGVYYSNQTLYLSYQQYVLGTPLTVDGDQSTEVFGYFTNWEFQLDEQWSIALGGRYTEERERINAFIDLSSVVPPGLGISIGDLQDQQRYYNTSFSFKTRYQFTDAILFYFAADTAYKSGGYNPQVAGMTSLNFLNPNFGLLEQELLLYPPEESTAFEIGVKSTWLDNRLRVNLALFDQDFRDFQNFQAADPARVSGFDLGESFINAADKVNTHGFELETFYLVNENWNTRFVASYAYATVQEFNLNFCQETALPADQLFCPINEDVRLSEDPLWDANWQIQYVHFLDWKDAEIVSNLSMTAQGPNLGEGYSAYSQGGEFNEPALVTTDFNIGLNFESWRVKFWITNLFDKEFFHTRELRSESSSQSLGLDNFYTGKNIKPRTIGFNVNYRFGAE